MDLDGPAIFYTFPRVAAQESFCGYKNKKRLPRRGAESLSRFVRACMGQNPKYGRELR